MSETNTMNGLRTALAELDENLEIDSPAYKAALILLASANVGPGADKIARLTGYPRREVREIGHRFWENGIWDGHKVNHSGWFDNDTGGIAFWLDVACGTGSLQRA